MRTSNTATSHVNVLASRAVESFGELAQVHVSLARAELIHDIRGLARDIALLAFAVPLIATGYVLLCGAASSALTPWTTQAGGLAIVGGLNLGVGGIAAWRAAVSLRTPPQLISTVGADLALSAKGVLPNFALVPPNQEPTRAR